MAAAVAVDEVAAAAVRACALPAVPCLMASLRRRRTTPTPPSMGTSRPPEPRCAAIYSSGGRLVLKTPKLHSALFHTATLNEQLGDRHACDHVACHRCGPCGWQPLHILYPIQSVCASGQTARRSAVSWEGGGGETSCGNPQVHMAQPVARALTAARSSRGNHRNKRLFMDTEGALQVAPLLHPLPS